jgi:hypothetical protein
MIPLIFALFLQACSLAPAPAPTATPADTATPTQTRIPTSTSTVTPSPTIVHFPTIDPNATSTPNAVPIFTGVKTATPIITLTPRPLLTSTPSGPGPGFKSITLSEHKLYWGICKPNKVKITVEVDDPDLVYNVVFFVRLKAVKKDDYTAWSNGAAMDDHGDGLWTYTLYTKTIKDRKNYAKSWIEYQIVATDRDGNFVGRSWIFAQSMTLQPCM